MGTQYRCTPALPESSGAVASMEFAPREQGLQLAVASTDGHVRSAQLGLKASSSVMACKDPMSTLPSWSVWWPGTALAQYVPRARTALAQHVPRAQNS